MNCGNPNRPQTTLLHRAAGPAQQTWEFLEGGARYLTNAFLTSSFSIVFSANRTSISSRARLLLGLALGQRKLSAQEAVPSLQPGRRKLTGVSEPKRGVGRLSHRGRGIHNRVMALESKKCGLEQWPWGGGQKRQT